MTTTSMKICFINNLWGEESRGGAERIQEAIITYLRQANHQVVVITTTTGTFSVEKEEGITVYRFRSSYSKIMPIWQRFLWHIIETLNPLFYYRVKAIIEKEEPDIVWTHNLTGLGLMILKIGELRSIIHLHSLHDIQLLHPSGLLFYGRETLVDTPWAHAYQLFVRRYLSQWTFVISPSEWLLNLYQQYGFFKKEKTFVLPNPLTQEFNISSHQRPGTPLTFLYVGQIEEHKGIINLLTAFAHCSNPDWKLLIAGTGRLLEIVQTSNSDNRISFLGQQTKEEIQNLMTNADCLVVPSLCYENYPTVLLEAIQAGLPAIGSDIGGIQEILAEPSLLYEPTSEALAEKLKWVSDNYRSFLEVSEQRYSTLRSISTKEYVETILSLVSWKV